MPFHGWEKQPLHGNLHRYGDALEELARQGFGPVDVCLYWTEHQNPECRQVFEERGFHTLTIGRREDANFLFRLRQTILAHAFVTSNRVATATFYALRLGRPFFLYGPPMGLSEHDDPTGEQFDAWQRSEFPALTFDAFTGSAERALGDRELGLEFQHTRDELRELFAWRDSHRTRRLLNAAQKSCYFARRTFSR
jgi:hypothetical protein